MADHLRDQIAKLFAALESNNDADAESAHLALDGLLRANRKGWSDLADLVRSGSIQLWPADGGLRGRVAKLVAMFGAPTLGERRTAQLKIMNILRNGKRTWADLAALLQSASYESWPDQQVEDAYFDAHVNL